MLHKHMNYAYRVCTAKNEFTGWKGIQKWFENQKGFLVDTIFAGKGGQEDESAKDPL